MRRTFWDNTLVAAGTSGARMERFRQVLAYDQALLLGFRRWQAPHLTRVMQALTRVGDASTWTAASLLLMAVGGPARRIGVLIGTSALASALCAQLLKRTWRRPRPSAHINAFTSLVPDPDAFSFPSGHTASAFAVATTLVGQGEWLSPFYFSLAFGIGLSRVYLGAHYPFDVMVGAGLGVSVGTLTRAVL
ncbi:MAG TPA: phosphatase PAP2 family protein [Myxococcaceae bacterium]|nr:phosphatase PAP2 family protein [Myxococcaceae bacterium]